MCRRTWLLSRPCEASISLRAASVAACLDRFSAAVRRQSMPCSRQPRTTSQCIVPCLWALSTDLPRCHHAATAIHGVGSHDDHTVLAWSVRVFLRPSSSYSSYASNSLVKVKSFRSCKGVCQAQRLLLLPAILWRTPNSEHCLLTSCIGACRLASRRSSYLSLRAAVVRGPLVAGRESAAVAGLWPTALSAR